jgi:hypothetical protein
LKWALGKGLLSLKRLNAEDLELEGGLLYWGPWVMNAKLWRRDSLFMGLSWATWSGLVYRGV